MSLRFLFVSLLAFFAMTAVAKSTVATDSTSVADVINFNDPDFYEPSLEELLIFDIEDNDLEVELDAIKDELVSFAKNFIGTRYRRGAKGPKAFDCSGFTSFVFRKFGYSLGPASHLQGTQGTSVDEYLDAQPGDLIFFSGSRTGRRVGHVGMVVDVDREKGTVHFIHASIRKGVVIDTYPDGGYYSRRFLGVRRILLTPWQGKDLGLQKTQ